MMDDKTIAPQKRHVSGEPCQPCPEEREAPYIPRYVPKLMRVHAPDGDGGGYFVMQESGIKRVPLTAEMEAYRLYVDPDAPHGRGSKAASCTTPVVEEKQ